MATLSDVQGIMNDHCAVLAQAQELSGDESAPSIDQALAWALRALGYAPASILAATAAEVMAVPPAQVDALLDLAELRLLESIRTNLTAVTVKAGPVQEDYNALSDRLAAIIKERQANAATRHGRWLAIPLTGNAAQAGNAEGDVSLRLLATKTASVQRAVIAEGKHGQPATVLSGLSCTPLYPADAGAVNNLLMRIKSETPYRILETFLTGRPDIRGGDLFLVEGDAYTVRAVAEWDMPGGSRQFTHLLVEDLPGP